MERIGKIVPPALFILIITLIHKCHPNPANTDSRQSALFPTASGPFYGIPYDTKVTERFLPFTATGTCEEGTIYNISHVDLLVKKHFSSLECIFHAADAPSKVPEGVWFGTILGGLNTRVFNPFFNSLPYWNGKIITKIDCDGLGTPGYYSFNNILGLPLAPAMESIGPIRENLAPGEYDDKRDVLIVDYTVDFKKECPNFPTYLKDNFETMPVKRRNLNGFWPATLINDYLRLVGRQKDGGAILLGKSVLRDAFREDFQGATFCWWAVVSYDPEVSPEFAEGQALPPQEKTFSYMFPGLGDAVLRFLPFDNFLSSPVKTLGRLTGIGTNWMRSATVYAREFLRSYSTFFGETVGFNNFFRNGRDGRRRVDHS